MKAPLYDDGQLRVTPNALRVFSRAYPLARVERLALRRDPLFIAAPPCLLALCFGWAFLDYLYAGEVLLIFALPVAVLYGASKLGVLYIQTGSHNAPAAIWSMSRLRRFYDAATAALPDHSMTN